MLWPFSLFSKSPASEEPRFEKTAPYIKSLMPTVTIDQLLIPGFVDKSVSDWLDGLKKVHFDDKHLENLERCFVTRIDHVALAGEEARRDWKAVHEAIALQFHYRTPTLASHGTPRQDDTRALMIHRVPKGVDGSKQQKIQGSKLLSSSKVAAHDEVLVRLNYDNLKTSDKPPPDFYPTPRSTKYFSMRRLEPRLDELEAKKNAYRREVDEERQEADRKLAEERQEADRKLAEERQEIERKLREERQEIERKLAEERQARQEERQESQREVAELREQVQRLAQAMSQLQPSSTTTPSGGSL
ncbi:hypothetical protein MIND_00018000 [Mycena indigotica]|uniref:Uncharacterized protein n=1 Tax=Mycena indigotica TaxID=2126181 RepID=A0A8H6TC92_9AGAR|nr:uncharacterized protein MIND_00018000 [Mycena indigotica]KAF7315038.1 hypothetical protein MIND_00018000 [Mycena indigotica]